VCAQRLTCFCIIRVPKLLAGKDTCEPPFEADPGNSRHRRICYWSMPAIAPLKDGIV